MNTASEEKEEEAWKTEEVPLTELSPASLSRPAPVQPEAAVVELVEPHEDHDEIVLRLRLRRHDERQQAALSQMLGEQRQLQEQVEGAQKELSRLGRSQFKANTLMEAAQENLTRLLNDLSQALQSRDQQIQQLLAASQNERRAARLELVKDLLPALDALDEAITLSERAEGEGRKAEGEGRRAKGEEPLSGWRKMVWRALTRGTPTLTPSPLHPFTPSPLAAAWREGLTLVRARLLAVLRVEGVEPMEAVGQPFDPRRHVAVDTTSDAALPDGGVVSEQLKGYVCGEQVLRFAEVVVNRRPSD